MIINDIQSRKLPKYRNGSYSARKTLVKCCLISLKNSPSTYQLEIQSSHQKYL